MLGAGGFQCRLVEVEQGFGAQCYLEQRLGCGRWFWLGFSDHYRGRFDAELVGKAQRQGIYAVFSDAAVIDAIARVLGAQVEAVVDGVLQAETEGFVDVTVTAIGQTATEGRAEVLLYFGVVDTKTRQKGQAINLEESADEVEAIAADFGVAASCAAGSSPALNPN
jgi:hypothetical protein